MKTVTRHLASVGVVAVMALLAFGSGSSVTEDGQGGGSTQAVAEPELGTAERLDSELAKALILSNRSSGRRFTFSTSEGTIRVTVAANDNLSQDMVVYGVKKDFADVLEAVKKSGYAYKRVRITVSFPLGDKYGNAAETQVADATFSRQTIERVNWESFMYENIWSIASRSRVHPAFR